MALPLGRVSETGVQQHPHTLRILPPPIQIRDEYASVKDVPLPGLLAAPPPLSGTTTPLLLGAPPSAIGEKPPRNYAMSMTKKQCKNSQWGLWDKDRHYRQKKNQKQWGLHKNRSTQFQWERIWRGLRGGGVKATRVWV